MNLFLCYILIMLGGKNHRLKPDRSAVFIVFHRYLTLAVGTQIGQCSIFADFGELPCQFMCQRDGIGHQFRCLIGGVTEHHSLVPCANGFQLGIAHTGLPGLQSLVNSHGYVGRLLIQCHHNCANIAVKTSLGIIIANLVHRFAHKGGNIKSCLCCNLSCHQDKTGTACRFAGYTAHGVLLHAGIQYCVRNRVTEFIRMSFGYGF